MYKRGWPGQKMATAINYCQNGLLAKAKVTLVFWTQALIKKNVFTLARFSGPVSARSARL